MTPWGDEIFYYGQVDFLKEAQKGKSWNWCEVRSDAIVGFGPGTTGMTFLEPIALFLSLWRYVHGEGAEIKFIGTSANYTHTNTDSSQDIIAKSEIYLSVTQPEKAAGEAFNTADYSTPTSWIDRWPAMVSYFGLKGTPPDEGSKTTFPEDKWWEEHRDDYEGMCTEYGLRKREIPKETWVFTLIAGYSLLCRDRASSLDKIRSVGFNESLALGEGYWIGFDCMVTANLIPPPSDTFKGRNDI